MPAPTTIVRGAMSEHLVDMDVHQRRVASTSGNPDQTIQVREARSAGPEQDVGAEVVLVRVDLVSAGQSAKHVGVGTPYAGRADLDAATVVGPQRVMGIELERAVGTHPLPVGPTREHGPSQPVAALERPAGQRYVPPLGVDDNWLVSGHGDHHQGTQVHSTDPGGPDALRFLSVQRSRLPWASCQSG